MKKLVSALLGVILVLSMCAPAMAAEAQSPDTVVEVTPSFLSIISPRFTNISAATLQIGSTYARAELTAYANCDLYADVTIYNANGGYLGSNNGSSYGRSLTVSKTYSFVKGTTYTVYAYYEANGESTSIEKTFTA